MEETYRSRDWFIVNHVIGDSSLEFRVGWEGYSDFFDTPETIEFVMKKPKLLASYLRKVKTEDLKIFDSMIRVAPKLAEACKDPKTSSPIASRIETTTNNEGQASSPYKTPNQSPNKEQWSQTTSKKRNYIQTTSPIKRQARISQFFSNNNIGSPEAICLPQRDMQLHEQPVGPPGRSASMVETLTILYERLGSYKIRDFECDPSLYSLPCFAKAFSYPDFKDKIEEYNLFSAKSFDMVEMLPQYTKGAITYFGSHEKHKNGIEAIIQCGNHVCPQISAFEVKFKGHPIADKLLVSEVLKVDPLAVWRFLECVKMKYPKKFEAWMQRENVYSKIYYKDNWIKSLPFIESKERSYLALRLGNKSK